MLYVSFLFDKAAALDVMIKKRFCTGGCGGGHFCITILL